MSSIELENVDVIYKLSSVTGRKNNFVSRLTVTNRLSDFRALKNISIELREGDKVALVGTNGSGKSTLLKVIAGVLPITSGKFNVNGNVFAMTSYYFGTSLINASCLQNIKLTGLERGYRREILQLFISKVIESFGHDEFIHSPISSLSSGMIQQLRLAIANCLNETAEIVVLDEWLGVIDMKLFGEGRKIGILSIIDDSKIAVIASHNKEIIKSLCNKGIYMENGEIKDFCNIESLNKYY